MLKLVQITSIANLEASLEYDGQACLDKNLTVKIRPRMARGRGLEKDRVSPCMTSVLFSVSCSISWSYSPSS